MLQELAIKNFAIIDALTISFDGGMTVLTGETGAGKSIIIDAVGLFKRLNLVCYSGQPTVQAAGPTHSWFRQPWRDQRLTFRWCCASRYGTGV